MTTAGTRLGVVLVPARGGLALDAALAAAGWADERAVLAFDGVVVPYGARTMTDPREVAGLDADWVLILGEAERVAPESVAALRGAIATAPADRIFELPVVASLLDMDVRLGRRAARLAPRRTPLVMRPGSSLEFHADGRRCALDVPIRRARGATLSDAVELAGAEAGTFAALADAGLRPARGIVVQPLVAALRAFMGNARGRRLGLGRWVIAVFEGYRVLVAYARLWERRRDRATVGG